MAHEDLARPHVVQGSSDRVFGLVFAVVFLGVGLRPLVSGEGPRLWALVAATGLVCVSLLKPRLLAVPNTLWLKLGLLLGALMSPIALGILFYGVFAPIAFLFRATGKDPLRLKRDPAAATYWIPREPPGPAPDSLTNQF
jgi:hypothetical protein